MNRMKCHLVILVMALIIIGSRGVCAAQFSQHASAQKSDTQQWNEVQLAVPINKSTDVLLTGTLRFGRQVSSPVEERIGGGFVFRIKRYLHVSPIYQYIWTQPGPGRKSSEHRLSVATTFRRAFERFTISDRSLLERRIRQPQIDSTRYSNRLQFERPISVAGLKMQGYASDEVFYDWSFRRWTRNQFTVGVSRRFTRHLVQDFYYARQNDATTRPGDLNIVGTTLRVRL